MSDLTKDDNFHFFEKQKKIYPHVVDGRYRRVKWLVMAVLLGIYYLVPFIRFDRGPGAPNQALLIDMNAPRGYFFWIEIWPQEVYYLTGILILAAIGLFCVTAILGRVWCGYACPQTVWTDLFILTEKWIQGDRAARMRLDAKPFGFEKLWKKTATHLSWIVISALTGGAWVLYFNDAPTLVDGLLHGHLSLEVGGWIAALTASTYLMAGFAREQVCIYMCPYARFQSAMFDRDTLIITYEDERGEPRGKHKKGTSWEGKGHCIDCDQCQVVCPMGIDIRRGLQYQCISCGMCVDACNAVMDKLELPRGLIRYDTSNNQTARQAAAKLGQNFVERLKVVRPRTVYYAVILILVSSLMLASLVLRQPVDLNAQHDRNPLFVLMADGQIRNGYTLKILNKAHVERRFRLDVQGLPGASLTVLNANPPDSNLLLVEPDDVGHFRVQVQAPAPAAPRTDILFTIRDENSDVGDKVHSVFVTGGKEAE